MADAVLVGADQKPLTGDQARILETVVTVFSAARTDDNVKFGSVVAPDFYLFENGIRFDGDAMMALIKVQHEAGKQFEWNVTEPDIHVSGDMAWIAYVNKGSITDAAGTTKQNWLESACLANQAGSWKIVFMHSTRVPLRREDDSSLGSAH